MENKELHFEFDTITIIKRADTKRELEEQAKRLGLSTYSIFYDDYNKKYVLAYEEEKKPNKYDEYIVFVLGTDNFELSQYIRNNPKRYGIDELYDLCIRIAKDFQEYDLAEERYNNYSQYESLTMFLEENTLKYMEIYNKGEF